MHLHKGFQRGFSLFVAMLFMLSVFPMAPVFAEGETIPIDGSALWYTLSDGTLTVGGTGDMPSYGYGKSPFVNNTTITALVIQPGVTSVGKYAFERCTALASVTLPDGITAIGDYAFDKCAALTAITIPASVESIGNYAFRSDTKTPNVLQTVTFEADSRLQKLGDGVFKDCKQLTAFAMPAGVTTLGKEVFSGCTALADLILSENIDSIGENAFKDCTSLVYNPYEGGNYLGSVEKPYLYLVTASAADITEFTVHESAKTILPGAFQGCAELVSAVIPDRFKVIPDNLFKECAKLSSVTFADDITAIGVGAFMKTGLTAISIPATVTSLGQNCFNACASLETVTFAAESQLATMGTGVFYKCVKLDGITLPATLTKIAGSTFYGCSSLTSYTISENVTAVGERVFQDCVLLTEMSFPAKVESIGYEALSGCKALKSVSFAADGALTDVGYNLFKNCALLETVTIPGTVNKLGSGVFNGCAKLSSVVFSAGVSFPTLDSSVFAGCTALEKVDIPSSVTSIAYSAFDGCTALATVNIPADSALTKIDYNAFKNCASLTKITVPATVTTIGHDAFSGCKALTTVTFGYSLLPALTKVDYNAFLNCEKLTAISLPASVKTIAKYAFSGCKSLTSFNVPRGTTSIAEGVFAGCDKLSELTVGALNTSFFADGNCIVGNDGKLVAGCNASEIPNDGSVTSIGKAAFESCTFTRIILPSSITSVIAGAFNKCLSLTNAYYLGNSEQWSAVTVGTNNTCLTDHLVCLFDAPTYTILDGVVTLDAVDGCEYSRDGVNWQASPVFGQLEPGSTHTFTRRLAATATSPASAPSASVTVTVPKLQNAAVPAAPTVVSFTDTTVTLTAVDGCEYRCDSGEWQISPVFTDLTPATDYTFCQRFAETDTTYAGPASAETTQKTDRSTVSAPAAPTLASGNDTSVTLQAVAGCEYKMDDGDWQASPVFTGLTVLTAHIFYQRYAETATAYASTPSEGLTVTVKYEAAAPAEPVISSATADTVTLVTVPGCEYKLDDGNWQASPVFTDLTPGATYIFYQRVAETEQFYAGPASALTFTLPKRTVGAPPKPVIVMNSNSIVVLLEVEGCEYSMDGISWQDSPVFTGISVDPAPVFYQRYKETATTYAGPASSTAEDEPQKIFGDLNDDGDINSDDLTMLACIVARIDEPTEQQLLVGDVTHDGNVNSDDLTKLAQYVARIIDSFD